MSKEAPLPLTIRPIRSAHGTLYGFTLPCGGLRSFDTIEDARAGLAKYLSQQRLR